MRSDPSEISTEYAIVGAGILGCSLAFHLARRGKRVVLLEQEETPASHASGKNAGMIRHLQTTPLLCEWAERSTLDWPAELRGRSFRQTGSAITLAESDLPLHSQRSFTDIISCGRGAVTLRCRRDGLLDSGPFVGGLLALARGAGARILYSTAATGLEPVNGEALRLVSGTKRIVTAERVVLAGGAWCRRLEAVVSLYAPSRINFRSYARYLAVLHGYAVSLLTEHGVGFMWDEVRAVYSRDWGQRERIVSGCERIEGTPWNFNPSDAFLASLVDKLGNEDCSVTVRRAWHCFRTYAGDELPVIGEDPRRPGVYWLAGFGGFGMSCGFAAAGELAASLVDGAPLPTELSPTRFLESESDVRG